MGDFDIYLLSLNGILRTTFSSIVQYIANCSKISFEQAYVELLDKQFVTMKISNIQFTLYPGHIISKLSPYSNGPEPPFFFLKESLPEVKCDLIQIKQPTVLQQDTYYLISPSYADQIKDFYSDSLK